MQLDGTTLHFLSFDEARLYAKAAKAVFTLLPPSSEEEGEKYTEGEWDLLFRLALQMAENDAEWASELVRSVVIPAIFMAALECMNAFQENPAVYIVPALGEFVDAYFSKEEADRAAQFYETWVDQAFLLGDHTQAIEDDPDPKD